MNWVKCSTFALAKAFFFSQKDFCLHVMHKTLQQDSGFLKEYVIYLSWAWKKANIPSSPQYCAFSQKETSNLDQKVVLTSGVCKERN